MSEKDENFITFLMKLVKDDNRAALAHLRRGLGKKAGTTMEMFPYIAPFIQSSYRNEENAYFLVASLVGLYPDALVSGYKSNRFNCLESSISEFCNGHSLSS